MKEKHAVLEGKPVGQAYLSSQCQPACVECLILEMPQIGLAVANQ
jgi:hypothetical protein